MNPMSSHLDRFRTPGFRSGLLAGLLCLLLLGGAFLFTPPAHAGAHGQQVAVASNSIFVNSFWIDGKNQNGRQVGTCLSYYLGVNNGYELLPGWWWIGTIRIVEYSDGSCSYPNNYICQGFHYVPPSMPGNVVDINADNGCS